MPEYLPNSVRPRFIPNEVVEHKHFYLTPFLLEIAYFKMIIRVPTNGF
jgi:hypothetical protein